MSAILLIGFMACEGKHQNEPVDQDETPSDETIQDDFVDLGLPSGTKWKRQNESNSQNPDGFYTFNEAVRVFGNKLPTKEQWEELIYNCSWEWSSNGYKVTGTNNNFIILPALGFYNSKYDTKSNPLWYGYYWSSTPDGLEHAKILYFYSSSVRINSQNRSDGCSIRLVR